MPTRTRIPLSVSVLNVRKANVVTNALTVTVYGIAMKIAGWLIVRGTRISVNCFKGGLEDRLERGVLFLLACEVQA